MVLNDWFLQRLANLTGVAIERPEVSETTALGAAYLAGLEGGFFSGDGGGGLGALESAWSREALFEPRTPAAEREELYDGWLEAVARVRQSAD